MSTESNTGCAQCCWRGQSGERECSEIALKDRGLCVLHIQDKGEALDLFKELVAKKLLQRDYVFAGVVFPNGTFTLFGEVDGVDFSEAEFQGSALFRDIKFLKDAKFNLAVFSADASFHNAEFDGQANFAGAQFLKTVNFFSAIIQGKADFSKAHLKDASYYQTNFFGDATFHGSKFSGPARFTQTAFRSAVDFEFAEFTATADFSLSAFGSYSSFASAHFDSEVDFVRAIFSGPVTFAFAESAGSRNRFVQAKFLSSAEFQSSSFINGIVDFSLCKFSNTANFAKARLQEGRFEATEFMGTAHFESIQVSAIATFKKATFREDAFFSSARFEAGGAEFKEALFAKNTDFSGGLLLNAGFETARFDGDASFSRTYFTGNRQFISVSGDRVLTGVATFFEAFFGGRASFTDFAFDGALDFRKTIFSGPLLFLPHMATSSAVLTGESVRKSSRVVPQDSSQPEHLSIHFDEAFFGQPASVKLYGVDLARTTFASANVRSVSFQNCVWPRVGNRFAVYDELCSSKDAEAVRLVYRDIKANFEDAHDWVLAGDFYYGEMEVLRKWRRGKGDRWYLVRRFLSPYTIYWLSSGYGEEPLRALLFFAGLTLIFATLFHAMCFTLQGHLLCRVSWAASIGHAIRILTLQRSFYIEPASEWAHRMTLLGNLLGPIQLAQIAISLQRRFRR